MVGVIPGVQGLLSHQLELSEIYEIGLHAYELKDYAHAVEWMKTALNTIGENNTKNGIKKDQILDYLAFSEFKVKHLILFTFCFFLQMMYKYYFLWSII